MHLEEYTILIAFEAHDSCIWVFLNISSSAPFSYTITQTQEHRGRHEINISDASVSPSNKENITVRTAKQILPAKNALIRAPHNQSRLGRLSFRHNKCDSRQLIGCRSFSHILVPVLPLVCRPATAVLARGEQTAGHDKYFDVVFCQRDVKVCDDGTLIQLLCFWTLSIVLFIFMSHNISETETGSYRFTQRIMPRNTIIRLTVFCRLFLSYFRRLFYDAISCYNTQHQLTAW
jgi:hypothetical protein